MKKFFIIQTSLALVTVLIATSGTVQAQSSQSPNVVARYAKSSQASVPARYAVANSKSDYAVHNVRWRNGYRGGYGYYGRPYGAYYAPRGYGYYGPRNYGAYNYGGNGYGYSNRYYGPRYGGYGYGAPYGTARVGPVRVFWR